MGKLLVPILIALILDFGADVSLFQMSSAAVSIFNPIVGAAMWWASVATVVKKIIFGPCRWSPAVLKMYAGMLLVLGFRARSPGFVNPGYSKWLILIFMLLFSPSEIVHFTSSWIIFDVLFERKSLQYSKTAIYKTQTLGSTVLRLPFAPGRQLQKALHLSPEDAPSKRLIFKTIIGAGFILLFFAFGAAIFSWCAKKVVQLLLNSVLIAAIKNFLLSNFPQYQMIDFLFKFIAKMFRSLNLV